LSPGTCAATINPHALVSAWSASSSFGGTDDCIDRRRLRSLVKILRRPFIPAIATHIRSMLPPRTHWIMRLAGLLRALGPYAAIELVLPGGTLIAIAVWAIRHRWSSAARARRADVQAGASDLREPAVDLQVGTP
jgi:hypothetical protein